MKMDPINSPAAAQAAQKIGTQYGAEKAVAPSSATMAEVQTSAVDFTHMTRNELLSWGLAQHDKGQLSGDAMDAIWSLSLNTSGLRLTANGRVERAFTPEEMKLQDSTEKVDFFSLAEKRVDFARSTGDSENAEFWQQALAMMQHYQSGFSAEA